MNLSSNDLPINIKNRVKFYKPKSQLRICKTVTDLSSLMNTSNKSNPVKFYLPLKKKNYPKEVFQSSRTKEFNNNLNQHKKISGYSGHHLNVDFGVERTPSSNNSVRRIERRILSRSPTHQKRYG